MKVPHCPDYMSHLNLWIHYCPVLCDRKICYCYIVYPLSRHIVSSIGLYCVFTVVSQRTPTISYISQEQIKDIGGTVELVCSVQYAQDYPVLWMRIDRSRQSDGLPISTGSTLIIRDSRFSLRYDTASSTYTLQVRGPCTACYYGAYVKKSWSWKCCVQWTELLISHTLYRPLLNSYLRNHHYEDELPALVCCLETSEIVRCLILVGNIIIIVVGAHQLLMQCVGYWYVQGKFDFVLWFVNLVMLILHYKCCYHRHFSFHGAGYIFHKPWLNYVTVNYHLHYNYHHQHCWCIQSVTFHIQVDTLLSSRHYHYGIIICCKFRASPPPLCSLLIKLIVLVCFFSLCPDFAFVLTCYSCILVFPIGRNGVSHLVSNDEYIAPEG